MDPQDATPWDCEDPPLTPVEREVLQAAVTYGNGISWAGDSAKRRQAAIDLIDAEYLRGNYTNCSITDAGREKLARDAKHGAPQNPYGEGDPAEIDGT